MEVTDLFKMLGKFSGAICPECGMPTLEFDGETIQCHSCGYMLLTHSSDEHDLDNLLTDSDLDLDDDTTTSSYDDIDLDCYDEDELNSPDFIGLLDEHDQLDDLDIDFRITTDDFSSEHSGYIDDFDDYD